VFGPLALIRFAGSRNEFELADPMFSLRASLEPLINSVDPLFTLVAAFCVVEHDAIEPEL